MNRTLHYAIVLSLALHGVILFGLSLQRDAAKRSPPPGPIAARLVEPPPPPSPPAPPQVQPAKPQPQLAPPPVVKPAPRPTPSPVAKAAPKPAPESVREPAPPATPETPAAAEPSRPSPPVASPVTPPSAPSPEATAASEASTREQYRLELINAARSHNRYPPLARENNWEGEVLVRMVIGPDGEIADLTVQKTSGHAVLDRQALEMFKRAQSRVPVPAALRGKEFAIELRAIYNLKDQLSG